MLKVTVCNRTVGHQRYRQYTSPMEWLEDRFKGDLLLHGNHSMTLKSAPYAWLVAMILNATWESCLTESEVLIRFPDDPRCLKVLHKDKKFTAQLGNWISATFTESLELSLSDLRLLLKFLKTEVSGIDLDETIGFNFEDAWYLSGLAHV